MTELALEKSLSTRELLAASGLSTQDVRRIFRFCSWSKEELVQQRGCSGWEDRMHLDAIGMENACAARAATKFLTELLSSQGMVTIAQKTTDELADLCTAESLRSVCSTYDPFVDGGKMVCGPTGCGKTAAGVAVVRRVAALPYGAWFANADTIERITENSGVPICVWVRAFDLPNARLQARFGEGETDMVTRAKYAAFLVIDDLGWESKRGGADDVVLEVIASRYDSGSPTYVTSGQTVSALIDRYGDAVVRKVQECGGKPGGVIDVWGDNR